MNLIKYGVASLLLAVGLLSTAGAQADEAQIRKTLQDRLPRLGKIDEVTKSPMPGLFEVRVGSDLFYSDAEGNYLIHGMLIDTKGQKNLTEARQEKLLAIDFAQLPLKDAFTMVRGNGKRKVAVFEDPNCGYCKRFERDLLKVDNVTVYLFLYPILGPDSIDKSRNIWCAADKSAAWLDWMVRDKPAPRSNCDSAAVTRNVEFGKKYKISGTPTLILANGTRVPGAITAPDLEKLLAEAK
ncbi:MAG: DsbC family protein [Ramlibacter sp.]|nr:DsbC family protein [Ramlibacter sp.]